MCLSGLKGWAGNPVDREIGLVRSNRTTSGAGEIPALSFSRMAEHNRLRGIPSVGIEATVPLSGPDRALLPMQDVGQFVLN